ncbi:MAG: PhnA domain-containing protein [Bacteroidia bacterium]|nr:PhnA domain-containing protein [Bacteroidia bacterium]
MSLENILKTRSNNQCELCGSSSTLSLVLVKPQTTPTEQNSFMACSKCQSEIESKETDPNHWRCLSSSIWSEVPGVQVVSYRMLHRLKGESWAQDLLDSMYLDDETLAWANAGLTEEHEEVGDLHLDSNGNQLQTGDTVVLIKSLDVKGSTLNAKMGTVVKNIRLVENNNTQIEGKIDGQVIVILTKYVRKQG